jgi:hypothetical protein
LLLAAVVVMMFMAVEAVRVVYLLDTQVLLLVLLTL